MGFEYLDYITNNKLEVAFADFNDKSKNYTSDSCDSSEKNECDECGVCGGKNECKICDDKTLYYTDCDNNCTNLEEYYNGECIPYTNFDCFGVYNSSGVLSKNIAGEGIICCNKQIDCFGSCHGSAEIDKCGNCVYGATGKTEEDSLDCYAVCNGTSKPPCNSNIIYNNSDIYVENEVTDLLFIDTIIPFYGFIDGNASVKFTKKYVYPQIPYYPSFDISVSQDLANYTTIGNGYDSTGYFLPNKTIYFRIIAITSRLNAYSPKSVDKHRINIYYIPIHNKNEITISFDVYLTYKNCTNRKGYEDCYLPGCYYCIGNGGFNVATEVTIINGMCIDGNISVCHQLLNKSDDGFIFIYNNLWLFLIILFIF